MLSQTSELIRTEITGNQLIDELKRELEQDPVPHNQENHNSRSMFYEYIMYWTYLIFIGTAPLVYITLTNIMEVSLVVPVSLLLLGIVSNLLTVWRIDRRVQTSSSKVEEGRFDSIVFTFYQLSIVQIIVIVSVIAADYLLSEYIVFSILGKRVDLYVILLLIVGVYLYVFRLSSISFNWYLTGQPFWIPMKEILVIPLSGVKKRLSIYRLLLWSLSSFVAYIQLRWPVSYPYLSLLLTVLFLLFGHRYIRADLKYTMRMSLTVTMRLKQSLPKPVVNHDLHYDPATAKNLLNKSSVDIRHDPVLSSSSTPTGRYGIRDAVDSKAKESIHKIVQKVMSQREEINRLYNETNSI